MESKLRFHVPHSLSLSLRSLKTKVLLHVYMTHVHICSTCTRVLLWYNVVYTVCTPGYRSTIEKIENVAETIIMGGQRPTAWDEIPTFPIPRKNNFTRCKERTDGDIYMGVQQKKKKRGFYSFLSFFNSFSTFFLAALLSTLPNAAIAVDNCSILLQW